MSAIFDRVRAVNQRVANLGVLAEPVRKLLWEANKERALRGVDPAGDAYAPLAPFTLRERAALGYPAGPPLVRVGEDAHVIQGCVITAQVEPDQIRFTKSWPNVDWMSEHIHGRPDMPVRNPLPLGTEQGTAGVMLRDWIIQGKTP